MEPIYEYFANQFGLGTLVLIIIIIALCFGVWKLAVKYTMWKSKADNLPCSRHDNEIQSLSQSINNVNVSLGRLETGLEGMNRMMTMMAGASMQSQFTQSHSPISLTPKGREIAQLLKFDEILFSNWHKIESIIDNEKNPYDIQMEFIAKFITDADKYIDETSIDAIKNDAYNRGVPLIDYMRMLAVMARDKYFIAHNISVEEVDKNDPNLK